MPTSRYTLGLSLGQSHEHTALAVLRAEGNGATTEFALVHLDRFTPGTRLADVAERVLAVLAAPDLVASSVSVVCDVTGVGFPAVASLRAAGIRRARALSLTVGDDGGGGRVPRRDLATALQLVVQDGRLKIAEGLPHADVLVEEMQAFRPKPTARSADADPLAWRERDAEDLVRALAVAAWIGSRPRVAGGALIGTRGRSIL